MLERISRDELDALAAGWNFTLDEREAEGLGAVAEDLLGLLDALDTGDGPPETPVEAVREVGERPSPEEDPLNAIVRTCRVRALQPGSALAGLRVAIKDSMAIAGVPLTFGSAVMDGFTPEVDALVIDRLLRAGAELVAIANMDDFAFSGGGDSSAYGPTLNPFDRTRTAAGSSGGSAAALYYDGIDAALGTDQGGSIRAPAAWCGVLGLKPTHSLVPYTGIGGIDATFDHVGPMTRTVADMARLLDVLAGPHPSDPRQVGNPPAPDFGVAVAETGEDLAGLRIGVVSEGSGEAVGTDPAVAVALRGVAERLRGLGAEVVDVSVPEHETAGAVAFAGFIEGMTALLTGGGNGYAWRGRYWPELADRMAVVLREHSGSLAYQIKVTLMLGLHLRRLRAGGVYARAQNQRPRLVAAYDRALDGVDCLLMPTTPGLPHQVDPDLGLHKRLMRGWALLANTSPTDMTGHPALSLPAAEAEGLPVGAMLIGRHFEDAGLLAAAAVYERAYGWSPARGPVFELNALEGATGSIHPG
jgi:amidase